MGEVDEICGRVAVLLRGRRIALGTPAELKREHTEHQVDVVLTDGSARVFDLTTDPARQDLAELVRAGRVLSMKSRAQDLEAAFLDIVSREGS
jgi:ABC-2 type transport system ATP-binding protein